MFISNDPMPKEELALRHARCRELMARFQPKAGGLMAFSRVGIYYLSGVMGTGVFWLPQEGNPLFLVRKGLERACLDSPHMTVAEYRSYGDLADKAAECGSPLSAVIAAEQSGLSWTMAENLQKRLPNVTFVSGDAVLPRARAVKTPWELAKIREAGARQAKAMEETLPKLLSPGMTELEISRKVLEVFFELGGLGSTRMSNFGEELILGQISSADNANYPSFYNGPVGGMGAHPSVPFLGCPKTVWTENNLLMIDVGFNYEGYNSDKTITYFAGTARAIPPLARKAHAVCCDIEAAVAERLRPGALPMDLYALAMDMAEKAGFAESFMGSGRNQVPFLGHGIGLCIDDWPPLAARFDVPVEKNMTFALEPKISLPGIGMVGTENTWEVVENGGAVCLSGGIRDILCVE